MKSFDAGKLDTPVVIKVPVFEVVGGEKVPSSWNVFLTTWAERKPMTKKEMEGVEAMTMTSSDYTNWKIRQPPLNSMPTTTMILVEDSGQEYDIENIRPEGRNQYLTLVCKQRQQR
jgi:hypothetical protein